MSCAKELGDQVGLKKADKNIKVSVVTVVFNGENCIEKTIQSVLSQSYRNIEFIVIDKYIITHDRYI